jgi:signal transduction histidine kinase
MAVECCLNDDELRDMFEAQLLQTMILGYMVRPGVLGGVMLRCLESPDSRSRVFYRCKDYYEHRSLVRSEWCKHMRGDGNLKVACEACDNLAFEVASECVSDPKWQGFAYICKGGLLDFVVPIRVERTGEFIGVAYHGQFRPVETSVDKCRERLRTFRMRIAEAMDLSEATAWYDGRRRVAKKDRQRMGSLIEERLRETEGRFNRGQAYILAVPLSEMLGEYMTAPMLDYGGEVLQFGPGFASAWRVDERARTRVCQEARLEKVVHSFQPLKPNGKPDSDRESMLDSCKRLASLVAGIAQPTVDQKIEAWTTRGIIQALLPANDVEEFWAALGKVGSLLSNWLQPEATLALRLDVGGENGDPEVVEVFADYAQEVSPADRARMAKALADSLTGAGKQGEMSCNEIYGLKLGSRGCVVIPICHRKKEVAVPRGTLVVVLASPSDVNRPDAPGRRALELIARILDERFNQLMTQEELSEQVEAHKKALLCMTHTIQKPLVDINGGITFVRSFGDVNNNVKHWLRHVKHTTEDAQVVAACITRIFKALLQGGRVGAAGEETVNVTREVISLAKRMRLYELDDDERSVKRNKKNLRVRYVETTATPAVRTDRQTFAFVIYNLLDNAIKYASRNSEIVIEYGYEHRDGRVCLKVKSIGEPIPIKLGEEDLPFKMFWRGQEHAQGRTAAHKCYPGLGVGLWACRFLLEAQGGRIWLVPKDKGWPDYRLSVFAVEFPFAEVAQDDGDSWREDLDG